MAHADLAKSSSDRQESWEFLIMGIKGLLIENWVANLSNASSLIWHHFQNFGADVNWAGFYVLDGDDRDQLVLGPFHGKPACQFIKIGNGVCGTAASTKNTQLVPNVDEFPSHIACDGDTKSEIVVPILYEERIVGVIDVDCLKLNGFDSLDQRYLEELATIIAPSLAASLK